MWSDAGRYEKGLLYKRLMAMIAAGDRILGIAVIMIVLYAMSPSYVPLISEYTGNHMVQDLSYTAAQKVAQAAAEDSLAAVYRIARNTCKGQ